MLNIDQIKNGIVIDHIKAGQGIKIFSWLGLDKASYTVAFVLNANSGRIGRKDLIKIDNTIAINFDILGLIDPNITVNIIEDGKISEKIKLKLPERVENVLICKNPRCITSTERYIPHIFRLDNRKLGSYRCEYCDELSTGDFLKQGL
ncbi:MAG: aspartate carbamoyltransferase regulatory subunit [Spirochaetaceae bacterium]|jgi:aspartate carbamoyltransferase regulatory subunit|nr:aspartate carbamoyltransferase regulatory subunit [Spirochaetaceae bacterium]